MINKIDKSNSHVGFVYVLCYSKYDDDIIQRVKIGSTKNPIMRLASHKYKKYKEYDVTIWRLCYCFDYLRCEAEIKKLTNGKEEFDHPGIKDIEKIYNIITRFKYYEMDTTQVEILLLVDSLKKYNYAK